MNIIERIYVQKVLAADLGSPTSSGVFGNVAKGSNSNASAEDLVSSIINVFLWVVGIIAFIYIVYSGILYLTAAGNEDNAKKGQKGILYGVIGIVVIVAAWVIIGAATDLGGEIGRTR